MEAAVVVDLAGLFQNQGNRFLRLHHDIPVAVSGGRGVDEDVLVDPLDGVTDPGRHFGRQEGG